MKHELYTQYIWFGHGLSDWGRIGKAFGASSACWKLRVATVAVPVLFGSRLPDPEGCDLKHLNCIDFLRFTHYATPKLPTPRSCTPPTHIFISLKRLAVAALSALSNESGADFRPYINPVHPRTDATYCTRPTKRQRLRTLQHQHVKYHER
jgi:hypothetical protein